MTSGTPDRNRLGVTLVELMIASLIIGLLVGFLLPMIGHVRDKARRTKVVSEVRMLEDAVTRFRASYGVYPPSRIHLKERGVYSAGPVPTRTVQYLRRIWPDFDVRSQVDFNGDGDATDTVRLNGSECLVFFLGGMPLPFVSGPLGRDTLLSIARSSDPSVLFEDVTNHGMDGFCRNPALPFARSNDVDASGNAIAGREQRTEPYFVFDPNRLSDVDADGFWEYYPPNLKPPGKGAFDPRLQPHPYVYASAYDGTGYNLVVTLDGDVRITHDTAWGILRDPFGLRWPVSRSWIKLDPSTPTERLAADFPPSTIRWWKPRSFQIIAPGLDGMLGEGESPEGIAAIDPRQALLTITDEMFDDLTNFSNGELADLE